MQLGRKVHAPEDAPEWLVDLLYGPTAPAELVYIGIVVAGLVVGLLAWHVEWDEELVREMANWLGPPAFIGFAVTLLGGPETSWTASTVSGVVLGGAVWWLVREQVRSVVVQAYRGKGSDAGE